MTAKNETVSEPAVKAQSPSAKPEPTSLVKYVGDASIRIISAEDWAKVGAKGVQDTVWDRKNKFTIPESELTDEQLDYIERDGGFEIVAGD
jgi:hypothetical protein